MQVVGGRVEISLLAYSKACDILPAMKRQLISVLPSHYTIIFLAGSLLFQIWQENTPKMTCDNIIGQLNQKAANMV